MTTNVATNTKKLKKKRKDSGRFKKPLINNISNYLNFKKRKEILF
jgi:hypothetical protein